MSAKRSTTASSKAEPVFHHRDIVLGKLRGYPPWPGMVADPDSVPPAVARERPKGTKIYCVQFFPAGDYAWLPPKELSKLSVSQIKSYIDEPSKKSGELLSGYKIRLDPSKWEEERMANLQEALDEDDEEEDQVADDDEEEEANASSSKAGKKRKRTSDVGIKKASSKKKEAPVSKGSKRGKNNAKSKATVESEDDGEEGASKKPPTKKPRKEREEEEIDPALAEDPEAQKVREWRHKLQKTFLGKTPAKNEDMPTADDLFRTVENYENMEIKYLQFSKIGKVMRHIAGLPDGTPPRDDEFKFRERAQKLVDKWAVKTNTEGGKKTNGSEETKGENGVSTDKATDGENDQNKVNGDAAEAATNGQLAGDVTMTDIGDLSVLPDVSMSEVNA
jgi:hypothetical protein